MSTAAAPARRRVPVPRLALGLAALGLVLELTGWLTRVAGAPASIARPLAMDAPFSLARMYVTALFAAAALVAAAGAGRLPGRRTWWTSVAAIAGGIAVVKAAGTAHARFVAAVGGGSSLQALAVSAALAGGVVGGLWWLSRHERRDRRRVLGCLGLYAGAAVGLSALSAAVGPAWSATATLVEESGEALAGVGLLVAVLLGVAPRLVLPASWPLRRADDQLTLGAELPAGTLAR